MNKIKYKYFLTKKFHLRMKMFDFPLVTSMQTLLCWSNSLVVLPLQDLMLCGSAGTMHRGMYSGAELHWETMLQPQRNISELKLFHFWKSWKFSLARSGKLTWKPQIKNTILEHFYSPSIWKEIVLLCVNTSAQCKDLNTFMFLYECAYLHCIRAYTC